MTDERMTGSVRKIVNRDNGSKFGFILGTNGVDYFFLPSMVQRMVPYTFDDLRVGVKVEFIPIAGEKEGQWRAIEIRKSGVVDGSNSPLSQPS